VHPQVFGGGGYGRAHDGGSVSVTVSLSEGRLLRAPEKQASHRRVHLGLLSQVKE
jgi:hypothetical protein